MAEWGAFGFGVVLGWLAYFTNRYRKAEVQFSDLTTFVGVIGGGAITALFGDAKTALFGAYCVGLAAGFFAYFLVLLIMVKCSNRVFTVTWFLDGRRKGLAEGEVIPGETRPTPAPMAVQLGAPQQAVAAPAVPGRSPLATAVEDRDRAMLAMVDSLRDLMRQIIATTDDAQRKGLQEKHDQLTGKYDEVVALRLKDVLESEQVRSALAKLNVITSDLVAGAREMKTTANAVATAAKIIDWATKLIGILITIFA
jgi:hypothetical protein